MKKTKFMILQTDGTKKEVVGDKINEWFGIYKRDDNMFALTALESGKLVCSSRLKKNLLLLANRPEFCQPLDDQNLQEVAKLSRVVKQFCDKHGWG